MELEGLEEDILQAGNTYVPQYVQRICISELVCDLITVEDALFSSVEQSKVVSQQQTMPSWVNTTRT